MFNDDPLWSIMMCDAGLRMFILSGTMLCLMMVNYGQLCGVMQDLDGSFYIAVMSFDEDYAILCNDVKKFFTLF